MDFIKLNHSKKIKISTNVGVVLILLFTILCFAQYYSMKLNVQNPLFPEHIIEIYTWPFLRKALILVVGLAAIFVLKYLKKHLLAFCITILFVLYYIFSDHYFGGWNTQIN